MFFLRELFARSLKYLNVPVHPRVAPFAFLRSTAMFEQVPPNLADLLGRAADLLGRGENHLVG